MRYQHQILYKTLLGEFSNRLPSASKIEKTAFFDDFDGFSKKNQFLPFFYTETYSAFCFILQYFVYLHLNSSQVFFKSADEPYEPSCGGSKMPIFALFRPKTGLLNFAIFFKTNTSWKILLFRIYGGLYRKEAFKKNPS